MSSFPLTNSFQRGSNHQPVYFCKCSLMSCPHLPESGSLFFYVILSFLFLLLPLLLAKSLCSLFLTIYFLDRVFTYQRNKNTEYLRLSISIRSLCFFARPPLYELNCQVRVCHQIHVCFLKSNHIFPSYVY